MARNTAEPAGISVWASSNIVILGVSNATGFGPRAHADK
jgi:hypothetical protein